MLFAADYPFLDLFWSMIIFFCWVAWIWMVIAIFSDIFRRHDASGGKKAIWCAFLILVPFLGALIYLIVNGDGMAERQRERVQQSESQFAGYVQSVAGANGGSASELTKAKALLDDGTITQAEFDTLKAKALA
ncbi:SHOCT domain-containing protein [Solirubrobacter taibaiensis]|nr:SHOCT domain-containing protein [Solirubrobacter taibaiensis]